MFESLIINEDQATVGRDERYVSLTPIEYALFYALYFANGATITRNAMLGKAYSDSVGAKYTHWKFNSAKVILSRLRTKLKPLGLAIETIRPPPAPSTIPGIRAGGRMGTYRLVDLEAESLKHTTTEEQAA